MTFNGSILSLRPGTQMKRRAVSALPLEVAGRVAAGGLNARSFAEATGGWLKDPTYTLDEGLAVFVIDGPVMFDDFWSAAWMSQPLAAEIRRAADDAGVKVLYLDLHCPGWTLFGMSAIYEALKYARAKKPMYGVANALIASGGMGIASQCHELVAIPEAELGWMGTYYVFVDMSKAYEQEGLETVVISEDCELKLMGVPGVPITAEMKASAQAICKQTHQIYLEGIASGRPRLTAQAIASFKGAGFAAADAVARGLADRIVPSEAAYRAEVKAKIKSGSGGSGRPSPGSNAKPPINPPRSGKGNAMTLEELMQQHPDLVSQVRARALTEAAAQPATFGQLDEAFGSVEGGDAFVTAAVRGKMTMPQAIAAFNKTRGEQTKALTEQVTRLTAENAELKKSPGSNKGSGGYPPPLNTHAGAGAGAGAGVGDGGAASGEQPSDFAAAVKLVAQVEKIDVGTTAGRSKATFKAVKQFPALYDQWRAAGAPNVFAA